MKRGPRKSLPSHFIINQIYLIIHDIVVLLLTTKKILTYYYGSHFLEPYTLVLKIDKVQHILTKVKLKNLAETTEI